MGRKKVIVIVIFIVNFSYLCNNKPYHPMKKPLFLLLLALINLVPGTRAASVATTTPDYMLGGFPIVNFAMAAQVDSDGTLYGSILRNTGRLGGWLENVGALNVSVITANGDHPLSTFQKKDINRSFPIVSATYRDSHILHSTLTIETFCPLVAHNGNDTALPVILLQVDVKATHDEVFSLHFVPDVHEGQDLTLTTDQPDIAPTAQALDIPLQLKAGECRRLRIVISHLDDTWVAAQRFADEQALAQYALAHWDHLAAGTRLFNDALPYTGDSRIDPYLPCYLLPALILTRLSAQGDVLTMGYCELNQRDSFWTTWLHLFLYPDLEWTMIQESYAAMRPSGKIPTCILPTIERWDDLDINLFLLLRTARYYAVWQNRSDLMTLWPQMCRCMDWVISRDNSHRGLPEQVSFWCDWKDVPYMQDRRYSPFVAMLYLAALDQMQKIAAICGDDERCRHYAEVYQQAYEFTNRSTDEGGLWNGSFYAQIQKDGTVSNLLTQDQMVGVLYGVIPHERAEAIIQALNTHALTPYGICNMWPYIPSVTDPEGTYHNGGMWPWMSFMDCWARIEAGHRDEAIDLMQRVFRADIDDSGDAVPNEHINTLTGENLGFPIQGWNANLIGLLYFAFRYPTLPFHL